MVVMTVYCSFSTREKKPSPFNWNRDSLSFQLKRAFSTTDSSSADVFVCMISIAWRRFNRYYVCLRASHRTWKCVHYWFPCHLMSNVSASTVRPHTLMLRLIWYGLLFHTHSIWFAIICRRKPNAHAKRKLEMIALSHIEPIKMPSLAYSINTLLAFCNKNKNKEF